MLRTLLCLVLLASPALAAQPGVVVKKDIPYAGTDDPRQKLDLYLPSNVPAGKILPLVIFIHGGAWREGNKSDAAAIMKSVVGTGSFAAASIGYRLSGQAVWPAQIHDCKAAVRYLHANARELGLDPDHFAVSGMSAGGHLALLVGLDGESRILEGDEGAYPKESSKVCCVVNWFGPVDLVSMVWPDGKLKERVGENPFDQLFGVPVEKHPELAKEASPLTYIRAGNPPVFTAHGTADPLVPFAQAEELNDALGKAHVPSFLSPMVGAGHGFDSQELNLRIFAFLNRYVGNGLALDIPTAPIKMH